MTSRISVDLIVFDLDGTLADTLPDLTAAANFACRRLGLPEHSPAAIRGMIGGGERKLIERLVGPAHQDRVEECLGLYLDHYTRHNGELTRLYPGVPETLALLSGKRLAVLCRRFNLNEVSSVCHLHFELFQVQREGRILAGSLKGPLRGICRSHHPG